MASTGILLAVDSSILCHPSLCSIGARTSPSHLVCIPAHSLLAAESILRIPLSRGVLCSSHRLRPSGIWILK